MTINPLLRLAELGQSIWLDFITRDLLTSGALARLIREDGIRGMTSNPTIFEKAIAGSSDYDADIARLSAEGLEADAIFEMLALADVRAACDAFRPTYDRTEGRDGLVSIEVAPTLAHDVLGTVAQAERLWAALARPNAMIKIPGTRAGLPAIARCISAGINVNVTLLFSVERYQAVLDAFQTGLEDRAARREPVERIASVASFFVSRVDTRVDALLDRAGRTDGLRGRVAIANAALAYAVFQRSQATERWTALAASGARPQRPLWASTSAKDPRYPDVFYVEALVGSDTVNTLPPDTLAAYRDHGDPRPRIGDAMLDAPAVLDALERAGIDLGQVTAFLEEDGVGKFAASYHAVLERIEAKVGAMSGRAMARPY
jgi:transaldolase